MQTKVGGRDCAICATKIDTAACSMPGVEDGSVSSGTMMVNYDGSDEFGAIEKKVVGFGYSVWSLGRSCRKAWRPARRGTASRALPRR